MSAGLGAGQVGEGLLRAVGVACGFPCPGSREIHRGFASGRKKG